MQLVLGRRCFSKVVENIPQTKNSFNTYTRDGHFVGNEFVCVSEVCAFETV